MQTLGLVSRWYSWSSNRAALRTATHRYDTQLRDIACVFLLITSLSTLQVRTIWKAMKYNRPTFFGHRHKVPITRYRLLNNNLVFEYLSSFYFGSALKVAFCKAVKVR